MNQLAKKQESLPAPTDAFLMMLDKWASDPAVDPGKIEKYLDMKERVLAKQAETDFNAALNSAQAQMGRIEADAKNSQTHSNYASYAALDKALRPIYTDNGFALSFDTEASQSPDLVRVVCDVSHRGGHTKRYRMDIPADGKGAKGGDVMTKVHAAGAAMSYGQRYLLKSIFNVAVGSDDDDGNSGEALPNLWKTQETRKHYSTELQRAWGRNDAAGLVQLWNEIDTDQKANIWRDFNSVQRREMNDMIISQRKTGDAT